MKPVRKETVVIFGLSGSGKSFLAKLLSENLGYSWIRSDVIRKEIAGLDPKIRVKEEYQKGLYSPQMTRKVYEEMIKRASNERKEGKNVVIDATFLRRWQRSMVKEAFPQALFVMACAEEEVAIERLKNRKGDVSDADVKIYLKQKEDFEFPFEIDFVAVNTQRSQEDLLAILKKVVEDDLF